MVNGEMDDFVVDGGFEASVTQEYEKRHQPRVIKSNLKIAPLFQANFKGPYLSKLSGTSCCLHRFH